ncbi:hypothetical protein EV202_13113 [Bacteroides heparinolyticus]|uniref:Uncharacterized protein n=1 Tax=Prevotella heparinolytica TaxID=28113 RepID=A0A4R2M1N6_9BACE|nr:hypothetical protein [Bacteroides heparinolyticus]TCO87468.1 hypothetical protein EV202_13113 [Bacteroides heparinolyticus]
MKKIDFRKIKVSDIEGKETTMDIAKEMGNTIYKNTPDLGELEFAQEIYKRGEVEVTEERAAIVRKYMDVGQFFAYIKKAVNDELNRILTIKD